MVNLLPSFFVLKSKTGGARPARGHNLANAGTKCKKKQKLKVGSSYCQTPYFCPCGDNSKQKRLSPCGGHLLCLMSESSIDDSALEAGPLQGGLSFSMTYKGKA